MDGIKMLILLIVSCFSIAEGQSNAAFKYVKSCYSVGSTLTLEAKYTGSGTPSLVQWSYSGGTGINLMILESSCAVFGVVPDGYPSGTRMEPTCSTPTKTYGLIVTGLTSDELTKSWGATFTPPTGTAPAAVQVAITLCEPLTNITITTTTSSNTTTTPPSGSTKHPKTLSLTVIIVLCVVSVLLFAILIIICVCLRYKRNQSKQKENPQSCKQDHSSKENKRQFSEIGSSDMKDSEMKESKRVTNSSTNRSYAYEGDTTKKTEKL